MEMKDKPNKVTATLKVVVTGEFYDDDVTEELLRYAVEQDLEDAGFEVDVSILKELDAVKPQLSISGMWYECPVCHRHLLKNGDNYCARCGRRVKWE